MTFKSKEQKKQDKEKNKDTYISTVVQHLKLSSLGYAVISDILEHANSLYNTLTYNLRQGFFVYNTLNFQSIAYDLQTDFKENYHYKMLHSQAAQSVCHKVAENFKSFKQLLDKHYIDGSKKPKLPGYRIPGGMFEVTYPGQSVKIAVEHGIKFASVSTGLLFKKRHKEDVTGTHLNECIKIRVPDAVDVLTIVELTITSKHGEIYLHWVCRKTHVVITTLDKSHVLGVDIGLNNFVTCIPNTGEQGFIINGRPLKSINRFYNKTVSKLKKGKDVNFWSGSLARATQTRNNQVRDFIKKSSRIIINKCLETGIGKIVFGWNEGIKNEINNGRVNNQNFVQVPFTALRDTLKYLCERHGIEFIVVEESYTSKMSFFDGDELPVFGKETEAHKEHKPSGRRTRRGEYRTANGTIINADANGASNILRKAQIDISQITLRVCQAVAKINIWIGKKLPSRKGTAASLSCCTTIGVTEPAQ
ncbi:transposase [Aetokthonos hydrillicola Thurmond2011]|jgi:IS605 OrfB family transposase|uniref:Transposase n=1 Tax=Aetokthonos hydrillicola Thurmond2011 TaxID=2712845 RepID=A0AAP5I5Q4_9CYAN|nr:RNA-guided endonuclease TnpB family protein [Aetokthonos hydrillicola]MBO3458518.1 IS200/IS605 family element transposase accessory protein TnpB [Aetokthonos hydrillicola CCALA 1050]MBW4584962.1 transposase [Aetokthonos hydrillicola CCALA 1050]MDR9894279.1 transposase [Aetokthonos hydrillicola Thurmond2011]